MASGAIRSYDTYGEFANEWNMFSEKYLRLLWALLGELQPDECLVEIPEWLADEKTGFVNGATPTEFVGRIEDETDKAIQLSDSVAARSVAKLAHRIHHLEQGLAELEDENPERRELLERRLQSLRQEFDSRDELPGLQNPWLPKSQLIRTARRSDVRR